MARADLHDKTIAITGGSSGIGAATALACANAGMDVAICGRREEALMPVAEQVESLGRRCLTLVADVRRDDDVNAFIAATHEAFGRLDVAFANAGYGLYAPVVDCPDADLRDIFETNYYGTIRVVKAAVPLMRAAGRGQILICCSATSEISMPWYGAYSATKAAQDGMAGALRAELEPEGIAVTSVHPTPTRTSFFDNVTDPRGGKVPFNLNPWMMQTAETVARKIVAAIRRPRAEVWPSLGARLGLGLLTAFPGLQVMTVRRMARMRFGPDGPS